MAQEEQENNYPQIKEKHYKIYKKSSIQFCITRIWTLCIILIDDTMNINLHLFVKFPNL